MDLNASIANARTKFYDDHRKNTFFKQSQKFECATQVSQMFNIEVLLAKTAYRIPNTNKIMLEYPLFKTYATPDNYIQIATYITDLFRTTILETGSYEVHVDMNSFSISACERYRPALCIFNDICMADTTPYSTSLVKLVIYNKPSMITQCLNLIRTVADKTAMSKVVLVEKAVSPLMLEELRAQVMANLG